MIYDYVYSMNTETFFVKLISEFLSLVGEYLCRRFIPDLLDYRASYFSSAHSHFAGQHFKMGSFNKVKERGFYK